MFNERSRVICCERNHGIVLANFQNCKKKKKKKKKKKCISTFPVLFLLSRFTLHHGVSVNVADEQGNTALHYAAEAGHPEVTRLLVETGADASVVNKTGCSPLQGAAENRHQEVTEYLIQVKSFTA